MKKVIYKYTCPIEKDIISEMDGSIAPVQISMPINAEILCVQVQNGVPQIWASLSDTSAIPMSGRFIIRTFRWIGTGHQYSDNGIREYVGTVQLNEGAHILHLFMEKP